MRSIVLVMYVSAMMMDRCFGFFFGAPTSSGQVTRFLGIARKTTIFSDTKANVEQPCSIRLGSSRLPPFRALPIMATLGADDNARSSIGVSKEIQKDVGVGGGVNSIPAGSEQEEMEFKGIWVMMNGVSGKMGAEVAAACLRRGFRIAPYAICGSGGVEVNVSDLEGGNPTMVTAVASDDMEGCEMALAEVRRRCGGGRLIIVDYTHPSAVNANGEFYSKHGLNFVMGTTGGDRDVLLSAVMDGGVYAVIAPNMGKQIVALQSAIDIMAREFPGSFGGYKLEITESHQSWKADTSGTAKALAADFARLTGEDYKVEAIDKIREPEKQVEFGVPEEYLDGHAFHTYKLLSSDGTAEFQFRHNVCGRRMYAEGTADAVEFLDKKASSMAEKRVYNMLDVLREGGM